MGQLLDRLATDCEVTAIHNDVARRIAGSPVSETADDFGDELQMWMLTSEVDAMARLLDTEPGFAAHAILSGICQRPLARWFASTTDSDVRVEYGDPIPVVTRTFKSGSGLTPGLTSLLRGTLLGPEGFRLYDLQPPIGSNDAEQYLDVSLDYSDRLTIDEVTWDAASQTYPRMATIHPHGPDAYDLDQVERHPGGWWFGVVPAIWDCDRVLSALAAARHEKAMCAVLPEMSLPESRALADGLAANPDLYPRLVVAGSAHERRETASGEEERANRSVVYLDGGEFAEHSKIFAFHTDFFSNQNPRQAMPEGINGPRRLRVASGDLTRMAVVICSDLHSDAVRGVLERLTVNLLFVPTLTADEGMFGAAASSVAGISQGLSLMANGTLPSEPGAPPSPSFLQLLGVPWANTDHQVRRWPPTDGARQVVCVVEPMKLPDPRVWDGAI
jgi:hypothetical protein